MHFTGFFFTGVYNHGRQEARGLGCEAGKWLVWWWSASFWICDWIRRIHVPTVCAGLCGEPWSQSADLGSLRVCSGVCYTELGTIIPESGGEFISTLRRYGSAPAFFRRLHLCSGCEADGHLCNGVEYGRVRHSAFLPRPPSSSAGSGGHYACCGHRQHLGRPGCHQDPSGLLGGQSAGADVHRHGI